MKKIVFLFVINLLNFSFAIADEKLEQTLKDNISIYQETVSAAGNPNLPCSEVITHTSKDGCGSKVPASEWQEFKYNLDQISRNNSHDRIQHMDAYIAKVAEKDPEAAKELAIAFGNMERQQMLIAAMSIYNEELENEKPGIEHKVSSKNSAKLKLMGYSGGEIANFYSNFKASDVGKNLSVLRQYGMKLDPLTSEWTKENGATKGRISAASLAKDKELAQAFQQMFGDEAFKKITNPRKPNAVFLGNAVIAPNSANYTKAEWQTAAGQHLDFFYKEMKNMSSNISTLGSVWDSTVRKYTQGINSNKRLMDEQLGYQKVAEAHVEALQKMGFPQEEIFNLNQQILQMSNATSESVNDAYEAAESMRKKLYGIAGGALLAATPMGQTLLLASMKGGMAYLTGAGIALPFVREGVKAGLTVSANGGSWWCQFGSSMGNAVVDAGLTGITMTVLPGAAIGGIAKLSVTAAKYTGFTLLGVGTLMGGVQVYGQTLTCANAISTYNKLSNDIDRANSEKNPEAAKELYALAVDLKQNFLQKCSDAVLTGLDLTIAAMSIRAGIKQAAEAAKKVFSPEESALHALVPEGQIPSGNKRVPANYGNDVHQAPPHIVDMEGRACMAGGCHKIAPEFMGDMMGKITASGGKARLVDINGAEIPLDKLRRSPTSVDLDSLQVQVNGKWTAVASRKRAAIPKVVKPGELGDQTHVITEVKMPDGRTMIYDPTLADNLHSALQFHNVPMDSSGKKFQVLFTPEEHAQILLRAKAKYLELNAR